MHDNRPLIIQGEENYRKFLEAGKEHNSTKVLERFNKHHKNKEDYWQWSSSMTSEVEELNIPKQMEYYATEESYCCPNCGCPALEASDTECPICGQSVYNLEYMAQDLGVSVEVARAMIEERIRKMGE